MVFKLITYHLIKTNFQIGIRRDPNSSIEVASAGCQYFTAFFSLTNKFLGVDIWNSAMSC